MASGGTHGFLRGEFDFVAGDMFRGAHGYWATFQSEAVAANKLVAKALAKSVAQALRQGLVRPEVNSGTLEKVIQDPANRYADRFGFGVGLPEFLDDSDAKYYWQIEKGTDVHEDQQLTGVWADRVRRMGSGRRVAIGGAFPFDRGESFQQFVPMGRRHARLAMRKNGIPSKDRRTRGVIRNPIEPEHYFDRGWKEADVLNTIEREYDRIFRNIGFKVRWVNGVLTRTPMAGAKADERRRNRGDRL